jgi:hypothetical protein
VGNKHRPPVSSPYAHAHYDNDEGTQGNPWNIGYLLLAARGNVKFQVKGFKFSLKSSPVSLPGPSKLA